jgi:NAD(P)-dependent dehydrogenase (short-subunit alcohol dehydrogenase family)
MDLGLHNKTAIVTGGSRGIGKAVARELAREGVDVAIAARELARLELTAQELAAETGRKIVPLSYDASADASVREMVDAAMEALGGIDILVNAAARPDISPRPSIAEIDDSALWSDFNVKVMGYLRCIREVVPHMIERGGGRIVSVGGQSAFTTGSTIGAMRNISVAALSRSLADELAERNIRLNVVHPGATRTERTAELAAAQAQQGRPSESTLGRASLLGRMVDAGEVGYVVAFLVSDKAVAINGEGIGVAGGRRGSVRY